MYHARLTRVIADQHLLHSAMLELTYKCNLDCFYCYNDKEAKGTPLSFEQYLTLFDDLARMQTLFLTFTGGEPMVHPRFFDLGKAAAERGFAVRVRTNGHTLNRKLALRLQQEVDPYMLDISIHGATPETHDRQTRVPGSFNRLLKNIGEIKKIGLQQQLICTPTAWNQHEIEGVFKLADSLGLKLIIQGPVGPRDNGDTEPLTIQPDKQVWEKIRFLKRNSTENEENRIPIKDLDNKSESGKKAPQLSRTCNVGRVGVDIDPFGNVYPCMHIKDSAGSLHEQSITDIWKETSSGADGAFKRAQNEAVKAAEKFQGQKIEQFGAPTYCVAIAANCAKGCSSKSSAG
jgi:MoaA/NifB/PqqE/SkfB family radical SAM enzyme